MSQADERTRTSPAAPAPVLGSLDPGAPSPLRRGSIVRRVAAEPVTALLVQRALVMEVAHPMVGAGVQHHSSFRDRPLRRAWVTADAALRLLFGDDETARAAVRQIYDVHDRIHGDLGSGSLRWPEGTPYTAHDAALLLWVWATLVDTAQTAYTRWVRPFTPLEGEAFYAEMRALARFLGIPAGLLPGDRTAFSAYLDRVLADEALGTAPGSRLLARQILWYRHWTVPPPVVRLERVLACATLDPRLLERLDIGLSAGDEALGRRLDAWLAGWYGRLPRPGPGLLGTYVRVREPFIGVGRRLGRRCP